MATLNPTEDGEREDNFELQLSRVRGKIKRKFGEIINYLKARENKLFEELDQIRKSYQSYKKKLKTWEERNLELEIMKKRNEEKLPTSHERDLIEYILQQIETKREANKIPIEPKMVSFVCDINIILTEINKLGRLEEYVRIDYELKVHPIVSTCDRGDGLEQLNYPYGVSVDDITGNIYVVDCDNNCVKVFDKTGKYLFKFGDNLNEGKMDCPCCVAICGERVLISTGSLFNFCILYYQLDGKFVSQIGKSGKGEIEFSSPLGLTIDESNGDIYICDCNNNRIQILSNDFTFKSQFGEVSLKSPRDVKLSEKCICVLDTSNPCLHLFSYNLILQKIVISRGEGMQLINPFYFFIDGSNNILISDSNSDSILIFNPQFKLINKILVSARPMGVTLDDEGRVIVLCRAEKNCLQIH